MVSVNCIFCGKEFNVKPSALKKGRGKYCSRACANKGRPKKPQTMSKKCEFCGKEFEAKISEIKRGWAKYCSLSCSTKSKHKDITLKLCKICGKKFQAKSMSKTKYCSQQCYKNSRKNQGIIKKCLECGKEFKVPQWKIKKGEGIYCSRKCAGIAKSNKLRKELICGFCGKLFKVPAHVVKTRKYCSFECYQNQKNLELDEKKIERICKGCGKKFKVPQSVLKKGGGKYCSRECSKATLTIQCGYCGKDYVTTKSAVKYGRKYCGNECRDKAQSERISGKNGPNWRGGNVSVECDNCGKIFERGPSKVNQKNFCSNECFRKGISGENHPQWKGGISFEPYCPKFNESLKENVRDFWNRKCGICGKSEADNGKKLSVHHVNYEKMVCCEDIMPLFITACMSCHAHTNNNRGPWEYILTDFIMLWFDGESFYRKS
jgi:uncharacterized Zn-finger protein